MKKVSTKQAKKLTEWAKVSARRDAMLISKYGHLIDEWTGKCFMGRIEHHHNDRDRNNNTLKNCRTVSWKSHRYITDNNVRDVPDRLSLEERKQVKAKPSQPAPLVLAGYHTDFRPFSRDEQCGRKVKK